MNKRLPLLLSLIVTLAAFGACGSIGTIPAPPGQSTPCPSSCPPPVGYGENPTLLNADHFSLYYNQPWSVDSQDGKSATLLRDTDYGTVSAQFFSTTVQSGTTGQQLLSSFVSRNIDPNKFAGLRDHGPINGAEIGYVAGAGENFSAVVSQPNVPNFPIFMQALASTQGTTGIIFVVISPLDTRNPDPSNPRQVHSTAYDQLINTLVWK